MPSAHPVVLGVATAVGLGMLWSQASDQWAQEQEKKRERERQQRVTAMAEERSDYAKEQQDEQNMSRRIQRILRIENELDQLREVIETEGKAEAFFVRVPLIGGADSPEFIEYMALSLLGEADVLNKKGLEPEFATMQVSKRSAKLIVKWFLELASSQGCTSFYHSSGILSSGVLTFRGENRGGCAPRWQNPGWAHIEDKPTKLLPMPMYRP
jgi:hypothetical protein